eukprot:XP_001705110.1 Hypothetical protein GL50803_34649 [Giardia lamblia ATCC 50803]
MHGELEENCVRLLYDPLLLADLLRGHMQARVELIQPADFYVSELLGLLNEGCVDDALQLRRVGVVEDDTHF